MPDDTVTAYGMDLAYVHDAGYGAIARGAMERLLQELARRQVGHGLVIDLGCGSGILAEGISNAGYDVLGVDFSAAMIDIARIRAPRARFRCESLLAAEIPACAAVTASGEALNYLFDANNTPAGLHELFHRIYQSLTPGGIFLFDVADTRRRRVSPAQRFTLAPEWATLVEVQDDPDPALLVRRITTFRKDGELYRRSEELHRQRLYSRKELITSLRSAGFRVQILAGYGITPFPAGTFGVLAVKP